MIYALHGTLGSASDWDALDLPDLQAIDLWSSDATGLDEFGEALATQVVQSGDPCPVLLGYSMGGRLALHAMAARPELWSAAIIIAAHPGLASEEERQQRSQHDAIWAEKARGPHWEDFLNQWNAQSVLAGQPPSPAQLSLEPRREAIASSFERWSLGQQRHVASHLLSCHFPVLWITGERDQKFTELASEMGQVIGDFEHCILSDCGHRVIFEKPTSLSSEIRQFLKKRGIG